MLNGGVWQADVAGLPANQVALAFRAGDPSLDSAETKPAIVPQPGEPLLLVCALGMDDSGDAATAVDSSCPRRRPERQGRQTAILRPAGHQSSRNGGEFPCAADSISRRRAAAANFECSNGKAVVGWNSQTDEIKFASDENQRTRVSVSRDGKIILASK